MFLRNSIVLLILSAFALPVLSQNIPAIDLNLTAEEQGSLDEIGSLKDKLIFIGSMHDDKEEELMANLIQLALSNRVKLIMEAGLSQEAIDIYINETMSMNPYLSLKFKKNIVQSNSTNLYELSMAYMALLGQKRIIKTLKETTDDASQQVDMDLQTGHLVSKLSTITALLTANSKARLLLEKYSKKYANIWTKFKKLVELTQFTSPSDMSYESMAYHIKLIPNLNESFVATIQEELEWERFMKVYTYSCIADAELLSKDEKKSLFEKLSIKAHDVKSIEEFNKGMAEVIIPTRDRDTTKRIISLLSSDQKNKSSVPLVVLSGDTHVQNFKKMSVFSEATFFSPKETSTDFEVYGADISKTRNKAELHIFKTYGKNVPKIQFGMPR